MKRIINQLYSLESEFVFTVQDYRFFARRRKMLTKSDSQIKGMDSKNKGHQNKWKVEVKEAAHVQASSFEVRDPLESLVPSYHKRHERN